MNRNQMWVSALSIAVLSACAASYSYTKPGAPESQLASDLEQCRAAAEQRTGNRQAEEAVSSCMERKGYAVAKKDYGRLF